MQNAASPPAGITSLQRGLKLLRAIGEGDSVGMRLTELARQSGMTEATVHRLLKSLVAEGLVEQSEQRRYRLSLDLFVLAARAGNPSNLRDICRPSLIHLSATLNDTVFLLVRSGFHAVCVDRADGPFPIRSFTGDIGGRVPLGMGQGALVLLAFLPEDEREEVIRFNLPRLVDIGPYDEVYLRTEIEYVRGHGHAPHSSGLLPGMSGVAVPIFDTARRVVAALSVGTLSERLRPERLPTVVALLQRAAEAIGRKVSPFDPAVRRPMQYLGGVVAPGGSK
jgi:DNA-binding IclR family transcriptional regulator